MLLIPFETIIETFPGPVWTQDPGGRILWCNDTWRRYTGTGDRFPDNDDYSGYFHSEDRDKLLLAVKFSGAGSPIVVRTWQHGDRVGFSVKDNGMGIPESMLEKIFEPFVQLQHQPASGHSGLGLGLYISAGIIRRHGGDIGVESKTGAGALFFFTIPGQ